MTKLEDRVSFALNETRTLILGAQIFLGFQYRGPLEKIFESLPPWSRWGQILSLALMVWVTVVLIAPSLYHCIVSRGNNTEDAHSFATWAVEWALFPLSLSIGIEFARAGNVMLTATTSILTGLLCVVFAFLIWFVIPRMLRKNRSFHRKKEEKGMSHHYTPIADRLKHVLTEARVLLPGAQALLGFQLIAFLMDTFHELPSFLKYLHFLSTLAIGVSVVMLIAPAAFHRICENGEASERAYNFANAMVVMAALPLALGLAGDFWVVMLRVTNRMVVGGIAGALVFVFAVSVWFVFPCLRRYRRKHVR